MADFINYGDLQLEQLALLNNLANNVQNYVNTQPWSNKRKEKFMSAYSDIMNNGVLGASNSTGQWVLNTRNAIDLNSKDRKDREMYQEAAYFIQQQMAGLSSKATSEKEQEEKKKEELPTFDNEYFTNGFKTKLSNMWYGGNRDISINSDWNTLDERGENGLRGTSIRRERLAKTLESYLKDFDETKVNFENSPFKDATDFRNRLNTAISKLRSGEDVTDALNAIGLRSSDWFYDGSGDLYDVDTKGNPITYGQYAESKIKLEQQKALEEALLKLLKANAMRGILSLIGGIHAVEARNTPEAYQEYLTKYGTGQAGFNAVNNRVSELINKGYDAGQLTGADKKELGNLLYYIRSNNPNYKGLGDGTHTNVTDKEWEDLRLHTNSLSSVNRGNFVRLPWQTQDGRYTYVDNKGNLYFLKPNKGQKFANSTIRSKGYYDYKNNFLKSKLQLNQESPVLSQDKDILISDMTSMLGDIVSIGGGYAGLAGGATSLVADLYSDIRRGKDIGDVLKNLGKNIAWGAAGVIPGVKIGKLARTAARLYGALNSYGILTDPEIRKSWTKLMNSEDITSKDFENFKWTLHAITGGVNIARGYATNRNINNKINKNYTAETVTGKSVPLTSEQVSKINRIGGKKGQKAAEKAFEEITNEKPKVGSFKFLEESRAWYNPNRYSLRLRNWTSEDEILKPSSTVNMDAVNKFLEIDKNKPLIGFGNPLKAKFWTEGGPNRGGLTALLNPYRTLTTTSLLITSQNNSENNSQLLPNSPLINRPEPTLNIKKPILTNTQYKSRNMNEVEWQGRLIAKGLKEIDLFLKSYGEGNNSSKSPFVGGYGSSKNKIKAGEYSFDLGNGQKVTFKISKEDISKKSIGELRNRIQKQIKDQVLNKTDKATVGNILRKLKKQGFLKQGGKITDTQIDNFLKQYK